MLEIKIQEIIKHRERQLLGNKIRAECSQIDNIDARRDELKRLLELIGDHSEHNKIRKPREVECPKCGALVDVSDIEKYALVHCYDCDKSLEFIGTELILPDVD